MDGRPRLRPTRWRAHAPHDAHAPHRRPTKPGSWWLAAASALFDDGAMPDDRPRHASDPRFVQLDGSRGEGGGQILRTALTLAMLTGRPFRMRNIRAKRDKPGLRPQHLAAVRAAMTLCDAQVEGDRQGATTLRFEPGPVAARDLELRLGTAGATALVLHTIHLPIALRADRPVRVALVGGTFNDKAPSYPFLESTWRVHQAALGLPVALSMPLAGFYPAGGGRIEAWIEPARPLALVLEDRGPLGRIRGVAGVARLTRNNIADRMRTRAEEHLRAAGLDVPIEIETVEWPGGSPGAALSLVAEHDPATAPFTSVALGAPGKPAEAVADEAAGALLAELAHPGAVDAHSADQLLVPLSLAEGRSSFTLTAVTEHLRTNARTIGAFLDREIRVIEGGEGEFARVTIT